MNIRVDLNAPIKDGAEVVFRSPVDCSQVTGLVLYYDGDSQEFAFADAHGNNVGDIDHLFAENVVVKVILDVTTSMAFVQNADTNAYLEGRFDEVSVDDTCVSKKPWSSENIVDKLGIVTSISGDSGVEITDCIPVPIKGLKAWVMARQEGEGTPSAENVRPIIPYEGSMVTVGVDRTEDMPNPALYSSGTLPENCYGGYVDWTRGVFVQTHEYIVVDGTIGTYVMYSNAGTDGYFYAVDVIYKADKTAPGSSDARHDTALCDSFIYKKDENRMSLYFAKRNLWFNKVTGCDTVEKLKAYLKEHPVHIVYPLETPIEHPLADMPNEEIILTEAPCYIASDGSNIEVTYVADTKAYIDKKFNELAVAIIANA